MTRFQDLPVSELKNIIEAPILQFFYANLFLLFLYKLFFYGVLFLILH